MGGGISKRKRLKQFLVEIQTAQSVGQFESALALCQEASTKLEKNDQPSDIEMLKSMQEGIEQNLYTLRKLREKLSAQTKEVEELIESGNLKSAKTTASQALSTFNSEFESQYKDSGTWSKVAMETFSFRDCKWSSHHPSLRIDDKCIVCQEADEVGTAIINPTFPGGRLVCEIKIKKCNYDNKDMNIFFGVICQNDVDLDSFWYEEEFCGKTWFYSNDGDICSGDTVHSPSNMDVSKWVLRSGDTIQLDIESVGDGSCSVSFYKNCKKLPGSLAGFRCPVAPAVMMSSCDIGDTVELLYCFLSDSGSSQHSEQSAQNAPQVNNSSPKGQPLILPFILACRSYLEALSCLIDFQTPSQKTRFSTCWKALLVAFQRLSEDAGESFAAACREKLENLFYTLKGNHVDQVMASLQAAEDLVAAGKPRDALSYYDDAMTWIAKIEESGLSFHAQQQRLVAHSRVQNAVRNAERLFKRATTIQKSREVRYIKEGYLELIESCQQAITLFEEAGEPGRAKESVKLKAICELMQAASQACAKAEESIVNGNITGGTFHFEKAEEYYSAAQSKFEEAGHEEFTLEMGRRKIYANDIKQESLKAQEKSRKHLAAGQIEARMREIAEVSDDKPGTVEKDVESVHPALTGNLSKRRKVSRRTFSVFVASSYDDTGQERSLLANQVATLVRRAVDAYGYEFEIVDTFATLWNRSQVDPDFHFNEMCIRERQRCQNDSMGVDFLCLIGEDDNGLCFPKTIDCEMFESLVKHMVHVPDLRQLVLDCFVVDTNSSPKNYVLIPKEKKFPLLDSKDKKKRDSARQQWNQTFERLQKGFYDACKSMIYKGHTQQIRNGIVGKLGAVDSHSMKQKVREIFDGFDRDHSGSVDREELKNAFAKLDVEMQDEEIDKFMEQYDIDRSGTIDFEELLLMIESLLLDARNALDDPTQAQLIRTDHCHYFLQSLLSQQITDGMLNREYEDALSRTMAVLWDFEPFKTRPKENTKAVLNDSISQIREQYIKSNENEGIKEAQIERPSWFEFDSLSQLKEKIFRRFVPNFDEILAQGGSQQEQQFPASDKTNGFSSHDAILEEQHEDQTDLLQDDALRGEMVGLLQMRRTPFLRTCSDEDLCFLCKIASIVHHDASGVRTQDVVREQTENYSSEKAALWQQDIVRLQSEIEKLEQRKRTLKNAVEKTKIEDRIDSLNQDICTARADVSRAMYVIVKGSCKVFRKTDPKIPPARLQPGDAFGELYMLLGRARDSTIHADSDCFLAEITWNTVQPMLRKNQNILQRIHEMVAFWYVEMLSSAAMTRALPAIKQDQTSKISKIVQQFKSTLILMLENDELSALAKLCSILEVRDGTVLFCQDDGHESGWGPFGDSMFLLVEGELDVSILCEDDVDNTRTLSILRMNEAGQSVGDLSMVTEAPRAYTAKAVGRCVLVEVTKAAYSASVKRDVLGDVMAFIEERRSAGDTVDGRVISARSRQILKVAKSNLLKMMTEIELDYLASLSTFRQEKRGAIICLQGHEGHSMFVVIRGEFRVLVSFASGEEGREIARMRAGDTIGEMVIVFGDPWPGTVEACSPICELAEVSRKSVETVLHKRPEIAHELQTMLYGADPSGEIMRSRTPLGGRAATPGGILAGGLIQSQSMVVYPWRTEKQGHHISEHGGQRYISSFVSKVSFALLALIEPTLDAALKEEDDPMWLIINESSFHLEIAAKTTTCFVGRESDFAHTLVDFDKLEQLQIFNQPKCIVDGAAMGKTTLLAMSGIRAKLETPGSIVIYRFIGRSQTTINARHLLSSICLQLNCIFEGHSNIVCPSDVVELKSLLERFLENASEQEPIYIFIDGIDELEIPVGSEPKFDWIPKKLPKYSSIIFSLQSTSDECLNSLNKIFTGEFFHHIQPLSATQGDEILEQYLKSAGKKSFSVSHFEAIRSTCGNSAGIEGVTSNCSPLFLKLALQLSESWLSCDRAPSLPKTVSDLVLYILADLEAKHGKLLVNRSIGYLETSRDGLSSQELLDVLSCDNEVLDEIFGVHLPSFHRVPTISGRLFMKDFEIFLAEVYTGLVPIWKVSHRLVIMMAKQRYNLEDKQLRTLFHTMLAKYFCGLYLEDTEDLENSFGDRGLSRQSLFHLGSSKYFLHRRPRRANIRKIREMPYHICWSSSSFSGIDPISCTVESKSDYAGSKRAEREKIGQGWFEKYVCCLEFVEAACSLNMGPELTDDLLLARKIFRNSETIKQFHHFMLFNIHDLSNYSSLTVQHAMNASGHQRILNDRAQTLLFDTVLQGRDQECWLPPDCWIVHTNKAEFLDPLYNTLLGHYNGAFCIAISDGDDLVITAGADNVTRLHDFQSFREIRVQEGHTGAIRRCCFSKDQKQFLTASADESAILWDIRSGTPICRLQGHEGEVTDCCFLTKLIVATSSIDCTIKVWDVSIDNGKDPIVTMKGHGSAVVSCTPMCRGTQLISASYDKTIRIWQVKDAQCLLELRGHEGVIYNVGLSHNEKYLLSCSSDGSLKIWDLDLGLESQTLRYHEGAILCCAIDPTDRWVVTGSTDHTLRMFAVGTKAPAVIIGTHRKAVCNVLFTHKGQYIISAGADEVISVWDWQVALRIATDKTPRHQTSVTHTEFSLAGTHLVSMSKDGVVILRIIDSQGRSLLAQQITDPDEPAVACQFSPNGLILATLHSFGALLWSAQNGDLIGRLPSVKKLSSCVYPDEITYDIAPPMSPVVKPAVAQRAAAPDEKRTAQESAVPPPAEILRESSSRIPKTATLTVEQNRSSKKNDDLQKENSDDGFQRSLSSDLKNAEPQKTTSDQVVDMPTDEIDEGLAKDNCHLFTIDLDKDSPVETDLRVASDIDIEEVSELSKSFEVQTALEMIAAGMSTLKLMFQDRETLTTAKSGQTEPEQVRSDEQGATHLDSESQRSWRAHESSGAHHAILGAGFGSEVIMDESISAADLADKDTASKLESENSGEEQLGINDPICAKLVSSSLANDDETLQNQQAEVNNLADDNLVESSKIVSSMQAQLRNSDNILDCHRYEGVENAVIPEVVPAPDTLIRTSGLAQDNLIDSPDHAAVSMTFKQEAPLWKFGILLQDLYREDDIASAAPIEMKESTELEQLIIQEAEEDLESKENLEVVIPTEEDASEEVALPKDDSMLLHTPRSPVDMASVQRVLHLLDKLEATTDPKSTWFGQAAPVLNEISMESVCTKNVAVASRGIASLNNLVVEALLAYAEHPNAEVKLAAAQALSVIAQPNDSRVMEAMQSLLSKDVTSEIKDIASIMVKNFQDEGNMGNVELTTRNDEGKEIFVITVAEAVGIIAADESGTSDPFVVISIHENEANYSNTESPSEIRSHVQGRPLISALEEFPWIIEEALLRMQMKNAKVFEILSVLDMEEVLGRSNIVELEKESVLVHQDEMDQHMYLVVRGLLKVLVNLEDKQSPKGEDGQADSLAQDFGHHVAWLDKGDTFGEMSLLINDRCPATVIAAQSSVLIQIGPAALTGVESRRPEIMHSLRQTAIKMKSWFTQKKEVQKRHLVRKRRTTVQRKTLHPKWNESFTFQDMDPGCIVNVALFDHDVFGSHDFLGQATIGIASLALDQEQDEWHVLVPRTNEEVTGQIRIKVAFKTDRRPRIVLADGRTACSEADDRSLRVLLDGEAEEGRAEAAGGADGRRERPFGIFSVKDSITSWAVCPTNPRVVVLGDEVGRISLLHISDVETYKAEVSLSGDA